MNPTDPEESDTKSAGRPLGDSDDHKFARVIRYFLGHTVKRDGKNLPGPESEKD
jgi:hypothetical protein